MTYFIIIILIGKPKNPKKMKKMNLEIVANNSIKDVILINGEPLLGKENPYTPEMVDEVEKWYKELLEAAMEEGLSVHDIVEKILKERKEDGIDLARHVFLVGQILSHCDSEHNMHILSMVLSCKRGTPITEILSLQRNFALSHLAKKDKLDPYLEVKANMETLIVYSSIIYLMQHKDEAEACSLLLALQGFTPTN